MVSNVFIRSRQFRMSIREVRMLQDQATTDRDAVGNGPSYFQLCFVCFVPGDLGGNGQRLAGGDKFRNRKLRACFSVTMLCRTRMPE